MEPRSLRLFFARHIAAERGNFRLAFINIPDYSFLSDGNCFLILDFFFFFYYIDASLLLLASCFHEFCCMTILLDKLASKPVEGKNARYFGYLMRGGGKNVYISTYDWGTDEEEGNFGKSNQSNGRRDRVRDLWTRLMEGIWPCSACVRYATGILPCRSVGSDGRVP